MLCFSPVGSHSPPWHSRIPWRIATHCTIALLDPTACFSSVAPLDLTVHRCTDAPWHHCTIGSNGALPAQTCSRALMMQSISVRVAASMLYKRGAPAGKNHRGLSSWSITALLDSMAHCYTIAVLDPRAHCCTVRPGGAFLCHRTVALLDLRAHCRTAAPLDSTAHCCTIAPLRRWIQQRILAPLHRCTVGSNGAFLHRWI